MKMFIKGQLKNNKYLKLDDVIRCSLKSPDGSIDCGEQINKVVAISVSST